MAAAVPGIRNAETVRALHVGTDYATLWEC